MGANDLVLEAQVISNSGPIQVPIADREKVCLTADGILYVAQSYKQDMSVMSYIELLKHMDVEYRMVVVSVEQIQKNCTLVRNQRLCKMTVRLDRSKLRH
ncbi:hypothetical protein ACFS07_35705 [Undibacterium arcticum]